MRFAVYLSIVLIVCLPTVAWAAPGGDISIRSTSLQLQEQKGDIRFEGDVVVVMSEIALTCDLLTVRSAVSDPSRILSGKASGNVVLVRGDDRIQAGEVVFNLEAGQVVFTGVPRLTREDTTIEAKQIVYSIEEGTASFEGPVRALFKAPGD